MRRIFREKKTYALVPVPCERLEGGGIVGLQQVTYIGLLRLKIGRRRPDLNQPVGIEGAAGVSVNGLHGGDRFQALGRMWVRPDVLGLFLGLCQLIAG
jgi:hypothetical protein